MDQNRLIDWPYVIGLLLPVAVVLVLHAVVLVQERTRYDPQFSPSSIWINMTPPHRWQTTSSGSGRSWRKRVC